MRRSSWRCFERGGAFLGRAGATDDLLQVELDALVAAIHGQVADLGATTVAT